MIGASGKLPASALQMSAWVAKSAVVTGLTVRFPSTRERLSLQDMAEGGGFPDRCQGDFPFLSMGGREEHPPSMVSEVRNARRNGYPP